MHESKWVVQLHRGTIRLDRLSLHNRWRRFCDHIFEALVGACEDYDGLGLGLGCIAYDPSVRPQAVSTTTSDVCFEVSFRFEVRRRTPRITPQPHITNIHIISYIVSSALVALLASSARARVLMRLRFVTSRGFPYAT